MINKINNTSGNYRSLVPGLYNSSCGEDCNCESCNPSEKNKTKTEIFIEKAKKLHGDKYDYRKVDYVNARTKITITCPIHGDFLQRPNNHLGGQGCSKCRCEKLSKKFRKSKDDFIKKAKKIHEDIYDYSKVNYVNNKTKVTIICPKHGEFLQKPDNHLGGKGCPKCSNNKKSTLEEFIEKAKKFHGDIYNYQKVNYINAKTKVTIICPIHGEFLQSPYNHLGGQGCPMCNSSHMETNIRKLLINNNINFKEQWNWNWLKYKSLQYVDFYLPEYNIAIECQGEQHFKAFSYFGGEDNFKITQERDENKLKLCKEHGINILYYSNLGKKYPYPYNVITDINTLIDEIKRSV